MIRLLLLVLELLILSLALWLGNRLWWHRYSSAKKGFVLVLVGCAALVSISAAMAAPAPTRLVTLTGLDQGDAQALETSVYLESIRVEGVALESLEPEAGRWSAYKGRLCWFAPGDDRRASDQTDSVTFRIKASSKTQLTFLENRWRGKVLVQADGYQETVDTFWDGGDDSRSAAVTLPVPDFGTLVLAVVIPIVWFTITLAVLCAGATGLLELGSRGIAKCSDGFLRRGPFQKLSGYQFLFEELVKRDFKKKYKRTVLGMAWSVLSPLLNLLVMRLVFTQFFGNRVAHYTTYLFCGNLIFSYFNEATSQGMTSLRDNAGIFTKVNVPKYLFLFSKNVQTLINFGLTLCVFFVFCMLDNITFTWRLVCLLYPILCLVLFNIGVGLILSALFVFFKDIQYLWSVFTMLLMYMSAIFYTIDNYLPVAQHAFLLNPVYLFIRYFRKIVIEATIPSLWFHLLMLADTALALGVGFWMYKKNNTKFLYYV